MSALMWVLQVVCRLVAPLVLSLRRVVLGVLWAVMLSVPMVRVTRAMHRVTVRPVCAVGDALGTAVGGLEGGCRWCNGRWRRWCRRWWIG